MDTTTFFNDIW